MARGRMKKGHLTAVGAGDGTLIDQPIPLGDQSVEMLLQVGYAEADVVDPFPPFFDEAGDRRVGADRLQKLHVRIADGEKRGLDLLALHSFDVLDLEPEVFVNARILERADGDADVVEGWFGQVSSPGR